MSRKNKKFKKQLRVQILAEIQKGESRPKPAFDEIASPPTATQLRAGRNDASGIIASPTKKSNETKTENRGEPTVKKELLKILLTFGFLILVLVVLTIANQKIKFLDRGVERIFSWF